MGRSADYLPRHLAGRLRAYLRQFPVVLVLGARQIGKSTLLRHELRDWREVDLESPDQLLAVSTDPLFFLRENPKRVWFDEAQRLPELFTVLRSVVDRDRRPGRYVLCGSASPLLLQKAAETLSGRLGILELGGFTVTERLLRPPARALGLALSSTSTSAFVRRVQRPISLRTSARIAPLADMCAAGHFPEAVAQRSARHRWRWMDSYVRTIAVRDLAELGRALRPAGLLRLLKLLAARHGQLLNIHDLSQGFGCDPRTASGYLDVLEATFLWRRLTPFHANVSKRQIKSPKGYLRDSGLAHHLLGLGDQEAAALSPHAGALWEGWLLEELTAATHLLEPAPTLHFWRTLAGAEVDVVAEHGDRLLPIEIKRGVTIRSGDLASLRHFLDDNRPRAPFGIIVHEGDETVALDERLVAVPTRVLLGD